MTRDASETRRSLVLANIATLASTSAISDGAVVLKILDHLELPTDPPRLAPACVCLELAFDA